MRVLAADDDPIQLEAMRAWLSRLPATVVTTDNGSDAWDLLSKEEFDLAVIDLHMPKLDGFGLINWLRQTPRTIDLPIIVVTSRNDNDAIDQAYAAGASSFATKPVNWQLFLHQARFVMRAGQNERAIRAERLIQEAINRDKDEVLQLVLTGLADPATSTSAMMGDLDLLQQCFSGQMQAEACIMDDLLSAICEQVKPQLAAQNVNILQRESLEMIEAVIDPRLVSQALGHLCEALAGQSHAGSRIELSAYIDEEGALMISALCSGASQLPSSFGLSLARQVALVHQGQFVLHDTEGDGVAAVLQLPKTQARQKPRGSGESLKLARPQAVAS